MADNNYNKNNIEDINDVESPRPFRRERNLSNRNFAKRNSRRRFSTESHSSVDSTQSQLQSQQEAISDSSSSSSMHISYSVNSETESAAFNRKSLLKMLPPSANSEDEKELRIESRAGNQNDRPLSHSDPALLDVKGKVKRFETLQIEEKKIVTNSATGISSIGSKIKLRSLQQHKQQLGPLRVLPVLSRLRPIGSDADTRTSTTTTTSSFHTSIDEERSEDEVDEISDFEIDAGNENRKSIENEYILPEEAEEVREDKIPSPIPGTEINRERNNDGDDGGGGGPDTVLEYGINEFTKVETVRRSVSIKSTQVQDQLNAEIKSLISGNVENNDDKKTNKKDFPRNYRSTPRPKTEVIEFGNRPAIGKYNSLQHGSKDDHSKPETPTVDDEEEEPELRNKSIKVIQPILEELIKTEETYVENLFCGIANYGNIFQRRDLPVGLRGKKYVLLGNIEQIAEFHRDEFLPMLHRNRYDLKRLFDEFQLFIDQNCFYGYVIFTMNKQRSLKLCDIYKNYFKLIQTELDDKLGINSFLVQPIQRMARYPLLLQQFITTLFKNREFIMKPIIESCCRLEKKLRTLLTTTNESEVINDIVDCNEFNVFYQGKFRKVSDFQIIDHTLKRTYRGKVFIFDKCIIYTEIKGKNLVFHGRYPCEHIGIVPKTKYFTLFYERRKQQECDFHADPILIEQWQELIRDMVNTYVTEEKLKLQERYSRENDHLHRKPPSLSLFRDSNRFSSDSGIGNIWVMPKPEANEEIVNNRTTWYAVS